ncbi:MAG: nuclear transport factor 2 family protein [Pseudomonadota bacterium]
MTLMEIANELVAGCREGRERENLDKLYAPDAVSVEAADMSGQGRETHGLDGIKGKHEWWDANNEMTGGSVSDPFPHGDDRFAVIFEAQGKDKSSGEAFEMKEVAVYHVAGGKIVREEFFYPT